MSKNLVISLFVALAIVSKLGGGIEQIAYAQIWDIIPDVVNRNVSNLQINSNVLQHNNSQTNITSNCIAAISDIRNTTVSPRVGDGVSKSSVSSSLSSSESSPNCDPTQFSNSCGQLKTNILSPSSKTGNGLSTSSSKTSTNCGTQHFRHSIMVPLADTIKYHNVIKATSTPLSLSLDGTQYSHSCVKLKVHSSTPPVQEICGTNYDDYIIGSEGDDIIFGLRGNDIIRALSGNDLVYGGPGDDIVYGGAGDNELFGEDGNDNLIGGIGDDLLVGGLGNDRLYGNAGDDILQGGLGADYFDCGDGLDTVVDYTPTQGDVISVNCENVNLIH